MQRQKQKQNKVLIYFVKDHEHYLKGMFVTIPCIIAREYIKIEVAKKCY